MLWALCLSGLAQAGPPIHLQLEEDPIDGFALEHPCGTAVDSSGDIYVSDADAKVEVFAPSGTHLTSILDANDPCSVAVNGVGEVFVSEQATGKVVRYKPDTYPLDATPTYSPTEVIDSSGLAKGIAIDPTDERLYVAEGTRIAVYKFDGSFETFLGEGDLSEASGVAAYTYVRSSSEGTRILYAADKAGSKLKLFSGDIQLEGSLKTKALPNPKLRRTISGPKAGEDFGFGPAGALLAIDPGNGNAAGKCDQVGIQACTAGHLLVFDDAHDAVHEFDAAGEFLDRIEAEPSLADAEPTAMAIDRSGGPGDGRIYVTSGPGSGAKLLAFSPLVAPSRAPLKQQPPEPPSQAVPTARSVAVDSHGDSYVATTSAVKVFSSSGAFLTEFSDDEHPFDLAVDSKGSVYVLDQGEGVDTEVLTYYTPSAYPPVPGTTYVRHEPPVLKRIEQLAGDFIAIAANSVNDHIFVIGADRVIELGAPEEGSPILNSNFASTIPRPFETGIGVCGATGEVFFGGNPGVITVVDAAGTELLARITGVGGPGGKLFNNPEIAVEQDNCHVLVFEREGVAAREYDSRGGFVAEFGQFANFAQADIAIDDSTGPGKGTAYVVHDETAGGKPSVWAFGPLSYGEAPIAATGQPSEIGGGEATLNGTVDPRGFELEECRFEYLTDAQYLSNGKTFTGAASKDCAETPVQIGSGEGAVPVHADVEGLDPDGRYRFRLLAKSEYGKGAGDAILFGPPVLDLQPPTVLYDEAVLHAGVDPAGLPTSYHFEYGAPGGAPGEYANSTPLGELAPGEALVSVSAVIGDLKEGATYHFRIVAENDAATVPGADQELETLIRRGEPICPNPEYRGGLSALLPDCRAYELVTPPETGGLSPADKYEGAASFNNWLTVPRGPAAGERLSFSTLGTLPGFEGNGRNDSYLAERAVGAHPPAGWVSQSAGPTYSQASGAVPFLNGIATDQFYSSWFVTEREPTFEDTLPPGSNLHTPGEVGGSPCNLQPLQADFEMVGCGLLGTDTKAQFHYVSAGGEHVLFSSSAHLATEAAPAGTTAIYDRAKGSAGAAVVSLKPGDVPFGAGEGATYLGASEDGSAVAFSAAGKLYERRGGQTLEVGPGATFAGISTNGARLTYTAAGAIWSFDAEAEPPTSSEVGSGMPINVSPDGSHVLFSSTAVLTGAEENENGEAALAGEHNLYAWDGATTKFVAVAEDRDFEEFDGLNTVGLQYWTAAVNEATAGVRASSPTRATPDGGVLLFQSHARLSAYDNEGKGEIYRYETASGSLICVSCDPSGSPPSGDAILQDGRPVSPVSTLSTLIANLTDDGSQIFFQSPDRLLPEDANAARDVYEWRAQGTGEPTCVRAGGCLALISPGQGEGDSYLFSMSADGEDVFFWTEKKLVGQDVAGSKSIYDARVNGGIPDPPPPISCSPESCQGEGSPPPALPAPASAAVGEEPKSSSPRSCPKGKRKVRRGGKVRCVKRPSRQHDHNRKRKAGR